MNDNVDKQCGTVAASKDNGHSVQATNVLHTSLNTMISFFRVRLAKESEMNKWAENKSGLANIKWKYCVYLGAYCYLCTELPYPFDTHFICAFIQLLRFFSLLLKCVNSMKFMKISWSSQEEGNQTDL